VQQKPHHHLKLRQNDDANMRTGINDLAACFWAGYARQLNIRKRRKQSLQILPEKCMVVCKK
jgi:hypothetical protein